MKRAPGTRSLLAAAGCVVLYLAAHAIARAVPDSGAAALVRTLAAFPVIFFVPGPFWLRTFARRRELALGEFLLANTAVSAALLIALTTLLKLCGAAVMRTSLLACATACLAGGYAVFLRRGGAAIRDDLSPRAGTLVCLALALAGLYAAYRPYFTWGLDQHWVVDGNPINPIPASQRLGDWWFPGADDIASAAVMHVRGVEPVSDRTYRSHAETVEFLIESRSPRPQLYPLAFFFQSGRPLTLNASLGDRPLGELPLRPMIDVRCEHLIPRFHRLAWRRGVILVPGMNVLRFRASGAGDAGDLVIDDFSNLTKRRFLSLARGKYLFGEIGEFYDNIEVLDFSRHFRSRNFTYTDDLRPGVPGYTIVIPPLDFILKMFFIVLGADALNDIHLAYLGRMVVLYLALLVYLDVGGRPLPLRLAVLPILVILAESVNLINFGLAIGHDTMMCVWFLAAAYFLSRGDDGLFLLFAVFTCLTRNHGVLFILLAMLSHRIFHGEGRRLRRLLGFILLSGASYVALAAAIGHSTGVLRTVWVPDFLNENLKFRFDAARGAGELWRRCAVFTGWVAVTSCAQCLLLTFRKDRVSRYLLLPIAAYYPLVCMARFFKPYYLEMLVYPISLIAVRNLARLSDVRPRLAAATWAALLVLGGAAVAFLAVRPLVNPAFTTAFPGAWEHVAAFL